MFCVYRCEYRTVDKDGAPSLALLQLKDSANPAESGKLTLTKISDSVHDVILTSHAKNCSGVAATLSPQPLPESYALSMGIVGGCLSANGSDSDSEKYDKALYTMYLNLRSQSNSGNDRKLLLDGVVVGNSGKTVSMSCVEEKS